MKGFVLFLLIIFFVIFGIVIGSQNDQFITVNYLIAQTSMRLSTLMAITVSIGVLIGVLSLVLSWAGMRLKLSRAEQKLKKYRSE